MSMADKLDSDEPKRSSLSSDDDYHDADEIEGPQSNFLDSLILTASRQKTALPSGTDTSFSEERMVFEDGVDEGIPNLQKKKKKSVIFKPDDLIRDHFPTGRLWEPDPNEMAEDMIGLYSDACQMEKIKPIQKLLEQLERLDDLSTPIDTLDLAGVRLDHKTCETLEMVLGRLCMTCLDIQKSAVEDDGMIAICEMIEYYECVTRLNIAHNSKLKSRAWLSLGRMLKNSPFIDMLNVSYCGVDDQGLTLLLRSVRANCGLRTLYSDGNNLSGKGSFILMAAMKFNENLQELHIANNNLLPEDAMNIGGILRTNHSLKVLDMRDNYIQDVGLRHVCAGLAEQQHGLVCLNIGNNSFTPVGMEHVAAMLPCTRTLQEINFSNNRVGDSGVIQLKLSLLVNQSVTKMVLVNTRITCEGAIAVAEILAENKNLKQLDLRDNDIRVAGLMALSLAHKMNHRLTQLDVPKAPKSDQRDKQMISELLREIEAATLRNIKEEKERESLNTEGIEENEDLEQSLSEVPSTLEVDEEDKKPKQEDPFEVVAPVVTESNCVDERRLDAVVIFEHQIEEEADRRTSPDDEREGSPTTEENKGTSSSTDTRERDASPEEQESSSSSEEQPQELPDLLDQTTAAVLSSQERQGGDPGSEVHQLSCPPDVTDRMGPDVAQLSPSGEPPDVMAVAQQQQDSRGAHTVDLLNEGSQPMGQRRSVDLVESTETSQDTNSTDDADTDNYP